MESDQIRSDRTFRYLEVKCEIASNHKGVAGILKAEINVNFEAKSTHSSSLAGQLLTQFVYL